MPWTYHRIWNVSLRALALVTAFIATLLMFQAHQAAGDGITEFTYRDFDSFKCFMIINAIGSLYTVLVLLIPPESLLWRLLIVFDGIFAVLLTASSSAAVAVAVLNKTGSATAGWQPICGLVPKYCSSVNGALGLGFVGAFIYILLNLYSLHNLLNPFLIQNPTPAGLYL